MVRPTLQRDVTSKLLFNSQHRLAVAGVFLEAGADALRYEEVAGRAGISRSLAHKELGVLVAVGALHRLEVERSVYYQRVASAFWLLCEELGAR